MIAGGYSYIRVKDPLVIHDPIGKSPIMMKAISYLDSKKHVFYPAFLTNPKLFGGHVQTILTMIKADYVPIRLPTSIYFQYDENELFTFEDGGKTLISYKFDKCTDEKRDLLFFFSGQVGSNQSIYLKNIMKEAYDNRGYDVCMISFRGQSGTKLVTPQLYNALSVDDIREPMEHVLRTRCLNGTKAYAIGVSMGANILANYLGIYADNCVLSGAICIQAGIKKWEGVEFFRTSLRGVYNKAMGKS